MARPHASRTGLYRLVKPLDRPIGEAADRDGRADGCEYLATTAKERYDGDPGYRPRRLVTYLAQPEHVRLEPVHLEPAP
jgi:hypothetical protein